MIDWCYDMIDLTVPWVKQFILSLTNSRCYFSKETTYIEVKYLFQGCQKYYAMEFYIFYCFVRLILLPGLPFPFIRVYKPIGVYTQSVCDSCLSWIPYFPALSPRFTPAPATAHVHIVPCITHAPTSCSLYHAFVHVSILLLQMSIFFLPTHSTPIHLQSQFECRFLHDFAFLRSPSGRIHHTLFCIVCHFVCNSSSVAMEVLQEADPKRELEVQKVSQRGKSVQVKGGKLDWADPHADLTVSARPMGGSGAKMAQHKSHWAKPWCHHLVPLLTKLFCEQIMSSIVRWSLKALTAETCWLPTRHTAEWQASPFLKGDLSSTSLCLSHFPSFLLPARVFIP